MESGPGDPEMESAIASVERILGDEGKAVLWWVTPNPMFGNVTPAYMVMIGQKEKVYAYIRDAMSER